MMPTLRLKTGREWLKELNVGDEVLFSDEEKGIIEKSDDHSTHTINNKLIRLISGGYIADDSGHLPMTVAHVFRKATKEQPVIINGEAYI